jgi:hypothetical protein
MKIIDIGVCVNNNDPKGIGRIRYRPYGLFISEIEHGIIYDDWDENDPFLCLPFLPAHINVIPQVQQSVKIIKYDTDKDTQNVEYMGGPYTSPHDLNTQTFIAQHKNTTYGGVIVKDRKNIRTADQKIISPASRGAITNLKDFGIRGNYGSDIIFTESGVQLRGGLLVSKENGNKQTLTDFPLMSKKTGRFNLKKFPKTMEVRQDESIESNTTVEKIKYIIEYEVDNLTPTPETPTNISIFAYKVIGSYGNEFNTDVFGKSSVFPTNDTKIIKLINSDNTLSGATYTITSDSINGIYILIRETLHLIDTNDLSILKNTYSKETVHPFYFRPTDNFKQRTGTTQELINRDLIISKIQIRNVPEGYGLIYSKQSSSPTTKTSPKMVDVLKEIKNSGEQSFASLSADRIYLTSTTPNNGVNVKSINFNDLDEYELSQEDYMQKIDPNTYALVRGENLYNLLVAIINLLHSHVHNINDPLERGDPNWEKLNNLVQSMRGDILNDSIRIN